MADGSAGAHEPLTVIGSSSGRRGAPGRIPPRALRWASVLVVLGALEVFTRNGAIDRLILPPPTKIAEALVDALPTSEFLRDLGRTALTVLIASVLGAMLGVVMGVVGWRFPLLWRASEPLLIALYATPTIVFYPIIVVLLGGLGIWPIVIIAAGMTAIPVAINVNIGLREIPRTLLRLGASLNSSRRQMARLFIVPSVAPQAMPGLRIGVIYAMIATVAMEFILSDRGLGFRTGIDYRQFDPTQMWSMIVAVSLLAVGLNTLLTIAERAVRRDLH